MKLKYFLLLFGSLLALKNTTAQLAKLDSLRRLISTEKDENRKTDLLLLLSIEFRQINPDSSRLISERILQIADKKSNTDLKLKAELNTVYYFINSSKPDSGLTITEKNIKELKQKGNNDSLLAQYQSASGFSLMKMNRQKEALQQFYASLKIAEIIGDKKAQTRALHMIGWAQMELNQFQPAIEYFKSSLKIFTANKLPYLYPATFTNLAYCYGALQLYDSLYKYAK